MREGIRGPPPTAAGGRGGGGFAFTASQWKELEHQALAFKYIISGIPVPLHLISTLISTSSTSSTLFLHQHPLPIGWGCFQLGYGRNIDPEPGRCRRTDGKKWRCSKEACPNSKYCEKHINRGKSKSKKQIQIQPLNITSTTIATADSIPLPISCSVSPSYASANYTQKCPSLLPRQGQATEFYPIRSPCSSSQLSLHSTMSAQNQPAPMLLMDPELYDHQPSKTIRFEL